MDVITYPCGIKINPCQLEYTYTDILERKNGRVIRKLI